MTLCCVTVADVFVAAATEEHSGTFLHFLSALWCNCQLWVKKTDPVHPPTAAWTHAHTRFIFFSSANQMLVCHINIHRCYQGFQIEAEFTECMFRHARLHCRHMRDKRAVSQHRRGWCVLWCFWWDQCPLGDSSGSLHSGQAKDELTSDIGSSEDDCFLDCLKCLSWL